MKKDYFALWGILTVAFAIFLAMSMCDDIHIGDWHLKSSGMADALTLNAADESVSGDLVAEADSTDAAGAGVEAAASAPNRSSPNKNVKPKVLPYTPNSEPKTVLFIGDSMVECLGPRMAAYCKASGYDLYNVIWYSSTTERYGTTELLWNYIVNLQPDYVIISLGGNELFVRDIKEKRSKYVEQILSEVSTLPYLWIGPPNWKPDTGINSMIEGYVLPGCFFLSDGLKLNRKKDGAHPTAESSIVWMDKVAEWMPDNARYKLPFATPESSTARAKRVFVHQPDEKSPVAGTIQKEAPKAEKKEALNTYAL